MKRILVAGYYGMQNTGDDALLAAACWGARKFINAAHLWATAPVVPIITGGELIRPVYVSKARFPGDNGLRAYARAFLVDSIIFGGGSVFHTARDLRSKINFIKLAGKGPHAAVGVAVGPFANSEDERTCAELLKKLDFVGLRDQSSLEIVRELAPNVRSMKTFDLAPLLLLIAGNNIATPVSSPLRKGIGLALCDFEKFVGGDITHETVRREKIARLLTLIDPKDAEELVLIDFNGHPTFGDQGLHNEIATLATGRFKVRHVPYSPDPLSVLKEIAGLRAMVAMRLHAAVFAFLVETPTVLLSYHPKCLGWAGEIGMDSGSVFDSVDFDPLRVAEAVTRGARGGARGEAPSPILTPADAVQLALSNWSWTNE